MEKEVKTCKRCIMNDANDESIIFDEDGYCSYCNTAMNEMGSVYYQNEIGEKKLNELITKLKKEGEDKPYDCLMGISGGLDSSYLAYLGAKKWGLRILALHIDDDFDTEVSKRNIKRLSELPNLKLITIKPDKEQYIDITLAYIKAGVPDIPIPQDNILFATLYNFARKNKIHYFLSGGNFATECILQHIDGASAYDLVNIRDIYKKFGTKSIKKLHFISSYRKYLDTKLLHLYSLRPLNYINYSRNDAFAELKREIEFEYYGSKHLENTFTAFAQLVWLPQKFNIDKRTSHISSMIVSGQISRDEAVEEYSTPCISQNEIEDIINEVCNKLGISRKEMDNYIQAPTRKHTDFKTDRFDAFIRPILSHKKG